MFHDDPDIVHSYPTTFFVELAQFSLEISRVMKIPYREFRKDLVFLQEKRLTTVEKFRENVGGLPIHVFFRSWKLFINGGRLGLNASALQDEAIDAVKSGLSDTNLTGINEITDPFERVRSLFLPEHEDFDFYQQKSPFFFYTGRYFLKVWNLSEDEIHPDCIALEVDLYKRAQDCGVSVAPLVEAATKKTTHNGTTYQILGTECIHNSDMRVPSNIDELQRYSSSLVSNILQLHSGGILHGDLKPDNVLWDGIQLRIIDFGLAQSMSNGSTICQPGTKGFNAPEVENDGEINTRASDAFGVGATLNCIIKEMRETMYLKASDTTTIEFVISGLMKSDKKERMTLDAASQLLKDNVVSAMSQKRMKLNSGVSAPKQNFIFKERAIIMTN